MGPSVWLIAGPTASGKSALASRLAEALGGEVVNADSIQLYAGLPILGAAPDSEARARAPHHLYGIADPADVWSVGRWLRSATDVLARIGARDRPAIVVGGTGLYFRALTEGLADIPAIPLAVREAVRARYEKLGEVAFRAELHVLDPRSAERIPPGDRQRLTRALEVVEALGRPLDAWWAQATAALSTGTWRAVVLDPPRAALYARCDRRLEQMFETGALEEAAHLRARGLDPALPAMKALGVRELIAHLDGVLTLAEALVASQRETRRYVKRQATWFRRQAAGWPRIVEGDGEGQWRALQCLT